MTNGRQTPPQVRILAVELDRGVEAADRFERAPADGEVAAVEHRADAQYPLRRDMRERRERMVVRPGARVTDPVPVVELVRPGHRHRARTTDELPPHAFDHAGRRAPVRGD